MNDDWMGLREVVTYQQSTKDKKKAILEDFRATDVS